MFGSNSASTWRQAPHGDAGSCVSAAMTILVNSRQPAATAAKTALRSAQMVRPKLMFSTLQPSKTRPSLPTSAAPTKNFEYGAYARLATSIALSSSSLSVTCVNFDPSPRCCSVRGRPGGIVRSMRQCRSRAYGAQAAHLRKANVRRRRARPRGEFVFEADPVSRCQKRFFPQHSRSLQAH